MKINLKDLRGKEIESLELPSVFNTPFRPDIIKKVYVNVLSTKQGPVEKDFHALVKLLELQVSEVEELPIHPYHGRKITKK